MANKPNEDLLSSMLSAYLETRKIVNAAGKLGNTVVNDLLKQPEGKVDSTPIVIWPKSEEKAEVDEEAIVVGVKSYVTIEAPDLRSCLTKVQEIVNGMEEEPSSINISMLWEEGYIYGYEAVLI